MPLGGSRRRHAKLSSSSSSSSKKASPPPPISVTSTSSAENTNASTTPRYDVHSSSLRPSKRPGLANGRPERPCSGYKESKAMRLLDKENLNVFAYMQNDEDDEDQSPDEGSSDRSPRSSPSQSSPPRFTDMPQRSPRYSDLEVRAIQDSVQRTWGRASVHSDSGISVRSHSPEQDSPIMEDKLPLEHSTPMIEESCFENDEVQNNALQISPHLESRGSDFSHRNWPSLDTSQSSGPEAYQVSIPQIISPRPVSREDEIPEMQARPPSTLMQLRSRQASITSRPAKLGYDLLASKISTHDDAVLKPIYRKFEILNNRMLLYLQDEIAQMEDDLRELDTAISMEDVELGKRGPASRRSEAKLPSQLQWHRLDLLGRCFAKVEQYNRALASYSNLTKSLDPASHADIATYRQWISEHTPIAESEASFLDKQPDLLSVCPAPIIKPVQPHSRSGKDSEASSPTMSSSKIRTSASSNSKSKHKSKDIDPSLLVVCFALISTIVIFKVVPSILARLVISAIVGLAALAILQPGSLSSVHALREWKTGIAVYCAVMGVLAIVVA